MLQERSISMFGGGEAERWPLLPALIELAAGFGYLGGAAGEAFETATDEGAGPGLPQPNGAGPALAGPPPAGG
eukprot:3488981-Lingulodinium_polyedra.AAC.1